MKKTLIAHLILGVLAGAAATGAYAGQAQPSSTSVAREAITTDVSRIDSAPFTYSFAGTMNPSSSAQSFQIQFRLNGGGKWDIETHAFDKLRIQMVDATTGRTVAQRPVSSLPPAGTVADPLNKFPSYAVTHVGVDSTGKTLFVSIDMDKAAVSSIRPEFTLNGDSNLDYATSIAGADDWTLSPAGFSNPTALDPIVNPKAQLYELFTLVGDMNFDDKTVCTDIKKLPATFLHFTGITNAMSMATSGNGGTEDEHKRPNASNDIDLIVFPTNIKVNVLSTTNNLKLATGLNNSFVQNGTPINPSFVSSTQANLGTVALLQNASGYDADVTNRYLLAGGDGTRPGVGAMYTTGVAENSPATVNSGWVEAKDLKVTVKAAQGFAVGSTISLQKTAACNAAATDQMGISAAVTAATAAGPIVVGITSGKVNEAFGAVGTSPLYVCYNVDGINTIPSTSFYASATLEKGVAGTNLNEQNNTCEGPLISFGGSIKIDVRNYVSVKDQANTAWQGVIRLINNSDTRTGKIFAQVIHQNGEFGNWGQIAELKPRQALNMTAKQIEDQLVHTAAASGVVNGGNGSVAKPELDGVSSTRLRITAEGTDTLRVQNYMISPEGQIVEMSGSQGVDFAESQDRAPVGDGQHISQDAMSGIDGK